MTAMPSTRVYPVPGRARGTAFGLALIAFSLPAAAIIVTEGMVERQSAEAFEQMKARLPRVKNERVVHAVECVAYGIIAVLEGPAAQQNWEVVVFDDPSINAFAMAGGKIGVHTGIFKVANNQHALAAVLGHEIAHVTEHHVVKRANRQNLTGLGAGVLAILVGGGYGTQQAVASAASLGAELGLDKPYDRKAETDADLKGLTFMARAGFDPRETIDLWNNMDKLNKTSIPEFLSTHPSNDNRTARLVGALTDAIAEYEKALAAGRNPDCE